MRRKLTSEARALVRSFRASSHPPLQLRRPLRQLPGQSRLRALADIPTGGNHETKALETARTLYERLQILLPLLGGDDDVRDHVVARVDRHRSIEAPKDRESLTSSKT